MIASYPIALLMAVSSATIALHDIPDYHTGYLWFFHSNKHWQVAESLLDSCSSGKKGRRQLW